MVIDAALERARRAICGPLSVTVGRAGAAV
jgi:hypothetical protein